MPKLWNETIEAHRREVRGAVLDATAALVAEHGLRAVTMSQIAEQAGIGRATLYKYFPDVDAVVQAWHHREITSHLHQLAQVAEHTSDPARRLEAVLEAYALIARLAGRHHETEFAASLHRDEHLASAQRQLHEMIRDLIADGARAGDVRDDVAPGELASYCLHALSAAASLPSEAAVRRLLTVTRAGLRPPR